MTTISIAKIYVALMLFSQTIRLGASGLLWVTSSPSSAVNGQSPRKWLLSHCYPSPNQKEMSLRDLRWSCQSLCLPKHSGKSLEPAGLGAKAMWSWDLMEAIFPCVSDFSSLSQVWMLVDPAEMAAKLFQEGL